MKRKNEKQSIRRMLSTVSAILMLSLACSSVIHASDAEAPLEQTEETTQIAAIEAEAASIAAEEEAARIAAAEEAARIEAAEEAARIAAQEEASRAAEAEAASIAAEEEAARIAAQEEASRAAAEAEAASIAAEEEAARIAAQEEAARAAAEVEAASIAAEEEAARIAAQEEASRAAAEAEAASIAAEEEAARIAAQEEASRAAAEAAAAQAAAEEEAARITAQEEASMAAAEEAESTPEPQKQEPEEKKEEESEEESKAPETPKESEAQVIQNYLPFKVTAKLPETLAQGMFYDTSIEIETDGRGTIENLQLTLKNDHPGYVITSYNSIEAAQQGIMTTGIVGEGELKNNERTLRIQALPLASKIKVEHIIIYALQDVKIDEQKLSAKAHFEMTMAGVRYAGDDTWKIEAEAPVQALPEETDQSTEEQIRQEEEPVDVEAVNAGTVQEPEPEDQPTAENETEEESKASVTELEHIDQVQAAAPAEAENPEETSYVQEESKVTEVIASGEADDEDEMITVELIPDDEDEDSNEEMLDEAFEDEYYDDYGYYDDWVTYSSYDAGTVINTATPYVLVKSYSHKKTIRTGDAFGVEIEFLNTSQKASMDNVVVKVETSDSISLANGTNTLFISGIEAGGTNKQKLNLLAAAECKDLTQKITLSVSFEYVENNERKKGESEESITLPISQKDRLELKDPQYDAMQAGQEGVISVAYVNKGYTSLYNMEATLNLENASAVQRSVYAGNIESGKSGTLDFLVTPEMDGEYSGTVTLTYEDSSQKEVSVVVPLEFDVMTAYVEDDFSSEEALMEEEEYEEKAAGMPWIVVAASAAAATVLGTVLILRKKKKAKLETDVDVEEWFRDTKSSSGDEGENQ